MGEELVSEKGEGSRRSGASAGNDIGGILRMSNRWLIPLKKYYYRYNLYEVSMLSTLSNSPNR